MTPPLAMSIEFHPLQAHLAAEVRGIDLSRDLSGERWEEFFGGIHRFRVVIVRDQTIPPRRLIELAQRLGQPKPPVRPEFCHPDFPALTRLGNTILSGPDATYLNTQGVEWHFDNVGSDHPGYTLLHAVEAPTRGGDTLFACAAAGYEAQPPELKDWLGLTTVVHSFNAHNDKVASFADSNVKPHPDSMRSTHQDTVDPIVKVHPDTGERLLYVSHNMVKEFVGADFDTSMSKVMTALEYATREHLVYRHHWRPGDLAIFCNRSCMHSATAYDYPHERRLMHRISVTGHV